MRKNKGFTLLELLIVVVIIGIIAAIGLPNYSAIRDRALRKEANANLKLIIAAQKIYHMETGSYVTACWGAWTSDQETCLNNALRLSLTAGGASDKPNFDYESNGACAHCKSRANNETWCLTVNMTGDPGNTICGTSPCN